MHFWMLIVNVYIAAKAVSQRSCRHSLTVFPSLKYNLPTLMYGERRTHYLSISRGGGTACVSVYHTHETCTSLTQPGEPAPPQLQPLR